MVQSGRKVLSVYLTAIVVFSAFATGVFAGTAVAAAGNTVTAANDAYDFTGAANAPTDGVANVQSTEFQIVDGTGAGNSALEDEISLETDWTDEETRDVLNVQLVKQSNDGDRYELADLGVDGTTRFDISITTENYSPIVLLGAGNVADERGWSAVQNEDGTVTIDIAVQPISSDAYFTESGNTPPDSDFDGTLVATDHQDATVSMAITSLKDEEDTYREKRAGLLIGTDAQGLSFPRFVSEEFGGPRIEYSVKAPHFQPDGSTVNDGFYEAYIPQTVLDTWGDPSSSDLAATYSAGNSPVTAADVSASDGGDRLGVLAGIDYHYSSGTIQLGTNSGVDDGGGGGGDGDTTPPNADVVSDSTVTVGEAVTFDASGSTDNGEIVGYYWDFDGDGTADDLDGDGTPDATSATTTHTFTSTGTKTVTLIAFDGQRTGTDTVTVTVEPKSGGNAGWSGSNSNNRATGKPTAVTVDRGANESLSVTVERPRPGEPVAVDLSRTEGDEGRDVGLDGLNISVGTSDSFTLNTSASTDPPGESPELDTERTGSAEGLGYISVEHSVPDEDIDNVSFTFRVSGDRLDRRNTAPTDVVLYRHHDGAWTALNTTFRRTDGADRVFTAESPGLSVFAIGTDERNPSLSVTDAEVDAERITAGDDVTVVGTVTNDGNAKGSTAVALRVDGEVVAERTVTVASGDSRAVEFVRALDRPGRYGFAVDDASAGTVEVVAASTETTSSPTETSRTTTSRESVPGFGAGLAVVALFGSALLARRR